MQLIDQNDQNIYGGKKYDDKVEKPKKDKVKTPFKKRLKSINQLRLPH